MLPLHSIPLCLTPPHDAPSSKVGDLLELRLDLAVVQLLIRGWWAGYAVPNSAGEFQVSSPPPVRCCTRLSFLLVWFSSLPCSDHISLFWVVERLAVGWRCWFWWVRFSVMGFCFVAWCCSRCGRYLGNRALILFSVCLEWVFVGQSVTGFSSNYSCFCFLSKSLIEACIPTYLWTSNRMQGGGFCPIASLDLFRDAIGVRKTSPDNILRGKDVSLMEWLL